MLKKLFEYLTGGEIQVSDDKKKWTAEEANKYMQDTMLFTPRMFKIINELNPTAGVTFADFYNSIWEDGALSRKVKELIFMAGGVAYMSPRCIIHVYPAVKAGATVEEVFEAASVGMILAGFVPEGPGIPYAFEYAAKCVELAQKMINGEEWEYLPPPKWDHGVF
ncbi:carboxymuconolactone decarboxylase family protein [Metallumcola ferriviriculae]|uniref:Carboxymuconolactone decarboxylase family protein n=1 Tax=Metallumcola ferriviriculae TaxID=3039180 RepID=A0AAU0USG4_9FIRM|nr:carboxymuconolactone decarboxylase family protein [Desulfitibacteraceae bacterium MK1]